MRLTAITPALPWLLLARISSAQRVIDSLSFGPTGSTDRTDIPGWQITSVNHNVQILSDRVILTPPIPGNAKGALWSKNTAPSSDWMAEFQFRTIGQESGSGNLQIWYTKDKSNINTNSVYNVDNFDGLALVIDQYGGQGGSIRGFLNDGSQNFKTHSSLESLAFGHCTYSYRNLGRPSTMRISNRNGLAVSIDNKICFTSEKITLPAGYYFGITASTADSPDSFEIHKFEVSSSASAPAPPAAGNTQKGPPPVPPLQKLDSWDHLPGAPEAVPDADADDIKSQEAQFADLHNRLQSITHQVANMFTEFNMMRRKLEQYHVETVDKIQNMQGSKETGLPPETVNTINQLSSRMANVERLVETVKKEVESKDYREVLNKMHQSMESMQGGLSEHLPERIGHLMRASAPRMGLFLFIILGVQALVVGSYVVYKRRRNSMPKKYL